MELNFVVNKQLDKQMKLFADLSYNTSDACVQEIALLVSKMRELRNNLLRTGLSVYKKESKFYHLVDTDSIGVFTMTIARNTNGLPILYMKKWNWEIDPYVFPNLYPIVLKICQNYKDERDGGCGFTIVKDARGLENYVNNAQRGKGTISDTWFEHAGKFNNENGYIYAYVRMNNGDPKIITPDGLTHTIDDNYERQNADAKLGESILKQTIQKHIYSLLLNEYYIQRRKTLAERRNRRLNEAIDRSLRRVLRELLSRNR